MEQSSDKTGVTFKVDDVSPKVPLSEFYSKSYKSNLKKIITN